MASDKKIFTLKQVAQSIQKVISERYQQLYWVQTEMHKLNYTNKGHCYPELVHKENESIVVDMRATIWKTNYDKISKNFAEVVNEPLRDGMNLLVLVKISFHPLYGIGLEILDIDPTYTIGELEKERKETLLKLKNEGILNANQAQKFPLLPKRIAIISVSSSKGLSDFFSILGNNPNYRFFTMLFEAQLNGDLAIESIQKALAKIEKVKSHFDVVLIIRGGGGEIGLSCYNNYHLSKAIATFPLPILTGIGHSTNLTVTEMVAYRNAITPTELADMLLQSFYEYESTLENGKKFILREAKHLLSENSEILKNQMRLISKSSVQLLKENKHFLHLTIVHLKQFSNQFVTKKVTDLKWNAQNLRFCTESIQKRNLYFLQEQQNKLRLKSKNVFDIEKSKLTLFEKSVDLVNPKHILKRGFSLTLKNGKIINEKNPIVIGDEIETINFDFIYKSTINKIEKND